MDFQFLIFLFIALGKYSSITTAQDLSPEFEAIPQNIETVRGKSVNISCRIKGSSSLQIAWTKHGEKLTNERFSQTSSGDLQIRNVGFIDSGNYTCHAENKTWFVESSVLLKVKKETRILPSLGPSNIIAKTGDRVIFHCSAVCDDELELSIYWKKNGQTINFDSSKKLFQGNDFSLMINDVDELDSGEYTCIARTRLDEASASATLKVEPKMNIPETTSVNPTVSPPITAIDSLKIIPLGSCAFLLVLSNMPSTTNMFLSNRIQYQVIHGTEMGELQEGHLEIYSHNPTQAKLSGLKQNTNYRIFIGIKTTPNERNELISAENRFFIEKRIPAPDFSNSPLAEPDFEYNIIDINCRQLAIGIQWYPCGLKYDCGRRAAGCSFYVEYRLEGEDTFSKIVENENDFILIPGLARNTTDRKSVV